MGRFSRVTTERSAVVTRHAGPTTVGALDLFCEFSTSDAACGRVVGGQLSKQRNRRFGLNDFLRQYRAVRALGWRYNEGQGTVQTDRSV